MYYKGSPRPAEGLSVGMQLLHDRTGRICNDSWVGGQYARHPYCILVWMQGTISL